MDPRLVAETGVARLVGALSRTTGRGGGTTLPGKILWKIDPGAMTRLAGRLPGGVAIVSATNGKTTTTAMLAAIVGDRPTLAWNNSGANLASGVMSTLLEPGRRRLGVLEVDEFALPEVARRTAPAVVSLGNLFRDQLDRYGELEHIAERWRAMVAELPAMTTVVVNADDPLVASLAGDRERVLRFGIDDARLARPSLQHAADSKYCVRCGAAYDYRAAYVGHLGDWRCPACGDERPALDVSASEIDLQGLEAVTFTLRTPAGSRQVTLPLPGLYNVYNAVAAATVAMALGHTLDDVVRALLDFRAAFGRFERIPIDGREAVLLLIKNPAGANEAIRTLLDGDLPGTVLVALNDAIADGRDISWIWDVDFEPMLEVAERIVVSGQRAAELALRFTYAGFPADRLEVTPALEAALDRAVSIAAPGARLAVLPTYTAMLELRRLAATRGLVRPYWEQ
jgi:UDP-N-acetylmuramyl tripeptide synthase